MRVLVATDLHLGAHENDEVRREDSFRAFREVLQLARTHAADCVLLAGDLFHENVPSRRTLREAMSAVRTHALGPGDVPLRVVSDSARDFPSAGLANFESPHHNIQLPLFSIHGNHDDPSGPDRSSALDVLSDARLLNYFGRHDFHESPPTRPSTEHDHNHEDPTDDDTSRPTAGRGISTSRTRRRSAASCSDSGPGRIVIRPVLLEKGNARLALYGLGHLRDARLKAIFERPNGVQVMRPPDTSERPRDSWVNAMLVHQNRSQNSPNALPEAYLPSFMDLTLWGHEHECQLGENPSSIQPSDGGGRIFQLGSSVQTSLEEGEAAQKKVGLLEVAQTGRWRMRALPLTSVRQFMFEKVTLRDEDELDDTAEMDQMMKDIDRLLDARVRNLISRAAEMRRSEQPELPLVRIRVDYTGFTTLSTRQFGQRFVRSVANPHDLLAFSKSTPRAKKADKSADGEEQEPPDIIEGRDEANQVEIEQFLSEQLGSLHVLQSDYLKSALDGLVNKNDRNAIDQTVKSALKDVRGRLLSSSTESNEQQDIDARIRDVNASRPRAAEHIASVQQDQQQNAEEVDDEDGEDANVGNQSTMDNMFSAEAASRQKRSNQQQNEQRQRPCTAQRRKRSESELTESQTERKRQRAQQNQQEQPSQQHSTQSRQRSQQATATGSQRQQQRTNRGSNAWANMRRAS